MKTTFFIGSVARIISTRETARELFKKLMKEKVTTLDFKDVDMISRSFAHEWISLEKEHNYEFRKIGMNKDVSFMFEYAEKKPSHNILKESGYKEISLNKLMSMA